MIKRLNLFSIFVFIFVMIFCFNTFCITNKMQQFIDDDRFKDGISWDVGEREL